MKPYKEKILVTGGAGFIGSHVVELFIEKKYSVVIVDDLSSGKIENVHPLAKFYLLDINHEELKKVFELEKPDYVCHLAAQISVSSSVKNPLNDAYRNILGLLNLLNCAKENKIKGMVFSSSGGTVYGEPEKFPLSEANPLNPASPYGIAKMTSEYYLDFYQKEYQLNYISLRYGNVYGPRQDPYGEAGVIAIFIKRMLEGEAPIINGDGEYIRDYVYVKDVANACLLSIENMLKLFEFRKADQLIYPFNAFNVGTGKGISVNQLFSYLKEIIPFPLSAQYGPPRPGDLRKNILESNLARKVLKWEPKNDIMDGLMHTVEWFKSII